MIKHAISLILYLLTANAAFALTDSVAGVSNFKFGMKVSDFNSIVFDREGEQGTIIYRSSKPLQIMNKAFEPFLIFDSSGLIAVDLKFSTKGADIAEARKTCEQLFGTAFGAIKAKYGNPDTGIKTEGNEYGTFNNVSFTAIDASGIHLSSFHLMVGCTIYVRYEKGDKNTF